MLVIFDLDGTLFKAKSVLPDSPPSDPDYHEILLQNVREHGELFPGVADALRELRDAGFVLRVCSASSPDYIEAALTSTGIRAFFESAHGAAGRDGKSEVFRTLAKPGGAVVIGDTWRDCAAARECGFFSVAALYGYGNRELIRADAYVWSAAEIPGAVARFPESVKLYGIQGM